MHYRNRRFEVYLMQAITNKSNSMIICPSRRAARVDFLLDGGKSIWEAIQDTPRSEIQDFV